MRLREKTFMGLFCYIKKRGYGQKPSHLFDLLRPLEEDPPVKSDRKLTWGIL